MYPKILLEEALRNIKYANFSKMKFYPVGTLKGSFIDIHKTFKT